MALKVGSILQERKIPYLYTIPFQYWNEDVSLKARVRFANTIHDPFNRIFCGFFSIHANSHDGTARGFEVYTSIGETESDYIAQVHYKNVDQRLGGRIRMRPGDKPGEVDKERKFYVLHRTKMPAVLIEHLYFDNFDDVCLLVDPEVIREFAEALADSIESWMKGSFYL
jgi:N-acetylmuramoyl-L-alanine amidase